jgi:hypothetical protein
VSSPWTFKESANSGGPPDLRGRRQNPRLKSMKSRVNSATYQLKPKAPAGLAWRTRDLPEGGLVAADKSVRGLGSSAPPFPKGGRTRLVDFPPEEIIIAGPRMDLGPANLTAETAGLLGEMPLPCRGVG